jgi:hypothetical protein
MRLLRNNTPAISAAGLSCEQLKNGLEQLRFGVVGAVSMATNDLDKAFHLKTKIVEGHDEIL